MFMSAMVQIFHSVKDPFHEDKVKWGEGFMNVAYGDILRLLKQITKKMCEYFCGEQWFRITEAKTASED